MKYLNCESLEYTLKALAEHTGKAKIIAGGTDLSLELEKGIHSNCEILIDVSRIKGLDQITLDENGNIHLGAMVTHNHVVGSTLLHKYAPLLVDACFGVGSPQIRNRGTVVGNLVTASPANDTISPLMALGAIVKIQSAKASREISLADFYTGVRKTKLSPDEFVVEVVFKALNENQKSIYKKYALRKAQAISLVNASMIVTLENKKVIDAQITLGAVAPVIIHSRRAEEYLIGKQFTTENVEKCAELVKEDVTPISDIRSSADYRVRISSLLVKRGLIELMTKKEQEIPEHPVLLWGKQTPNQSNVISGNEIIDEEKAIHFKVNGKAYSIKVNPTKSLLHMIREEVGLTGTKEGCGEGECGACTVFMDGVAVMSCLIPAARADGAEIVTVEGVSNGEQLHPVQQAFVEEGAVQCGYCTPGFVMSAVKLLEEKEHPDTDEIKLAITGNLCRCTGYYNIVKAIEKAAETN